MKMDSPPAVEVSPRPPPRTLWKWIELRHGLDHHAVVPISSGVVDNNNRLYVTTWRRDRNENNLNPDLIDISLRNFGEMMRVNFNQIQRHVDNPLPRGVQYVSWLRNRDSPPLPPVSPPAPPLAPPAAPWETAARGWVVGAALFLIVLILAKFVDRWIVNRLVKIRERRRSSQWSTPNVVATSIPELDEEESAVGEECPPPYALCALKDPPPPYTQVARTTRTPPHTHTRTPPHTETRTQPHPTHGDSPTPTTSQQSNTTDGAGGAGDDKLRDVVIPNESDTTVVNSDRNPKV